MDWVTLSIIAALGQVLRNAAMKSIGHKLDEYINVLGRFAFLLPFAAVAVWMKGVPEIQPGFWWICILFGFLQTLATLSLSKALLYGSMGVVTSLWKLATIWLVVLAFIVLGEAPSAWGLVGIFVTLAGVYGLNVSRARIGWFEPVRALFTDKGMRYTVLSSLLYAPSVITFKQAAVLSDAAFGTLATYAAASLVVLPLTLWKSAAHFKDAPKLWKGFIFLGLFAFIASLSQAEAFRLTLTSYVESVKQVEILLAIGIGYVFFKERERVRETLIGGVVILAGIILLILGG